MNFLKKAKSVVVHTGSRFKSSIAALCLFLMAFSTNALADVDPAVTQLATDLTAEISGLKAPLYTIGIAIIGLTVVFLIIGYVKGILRR